MEVDESCWLASLLVDAVSWQILDKILSCLECCMGEGRDKVYETFRLLVGVVDYTCFP